MTSENKNDKKTDHTSCTKPSCTCKQYTDARDLEEFEVNFGQIA